MASSQDDASSKLEAAARELLLGNLPLAESLCRAVATADPDESAMRENLLGMIFAARGLKDAAIESYRRAYELCPDHPSICFNLGGALLQRNQTHEALTLLKQAVELAPEYAEAHDALGEAYAAAGEPEPALECFREAVEVDPESAPRRNRLAHALLQAGQLEKALHHFDRLLALRPNDAQALHNRGLIQHRLGEHAQCAASLRQALSLDPDFAETHYGLGSALRQLDDLEGALASFANAQQLGLDDARVHYGLGEALARRNDVERAAGHLRRALELEPSHALAHNQLGQLLSAQARLDEAAIHFERALALAPDLAEAYNGLGVIHRVQGNLDAAEACFSRYLELGGDIGAYKNLGNVCLERRDLDQAYAYYQRALAGDPDDAGALWNQAHLLLIKGDYAAGWEFYAASRERDGPRPGFATGPQWRGEPLDGRAILVYGEQGLGDEIMFASVIPEIMREARQCVIECSPKLEKLFGRSFASAAVIGVDRGSPGWEQQAAQKLQATATVDLRIAMGSLPQYRRRAPAQFPRHAGYLQADAQRVAHWKRRLDALGPGLKVGISWRGGTPMTSIARSLPLVAWQPLLRIDGVHFVSLQYGGCREEIESSRARNGISVHHWQEAIDDYDETAALVQALDQVVSVCTAVIHLSGALGKPAWVLAPWVPEWRYGLSGDTMPWYPSVRLFRQQARGEWGPVVERVQIALQALARER